VDSEPPFAILGRAGTDVKERGDSVLCMHTCTHPPFPRLDIASIHAVVDTMTCTWPASNAEMAEVVFASKC